MYKKQKSTNNYTNYESISLLQFGKDLEGGLFKTEYHDALSFVPNSLVDWAKRSGLKIEITEIKNWENFETGKIDFATDDFYSLLFFDEKNTEEQIVFLSDELIKKNIAYKFTLLEFKSFVSFYQSNFNEEIFQPLDYVVFFPKKKKLRLIHHEGKLVSIYRA